MMTTINNVRPSAVELYYAGSGIPGEVTISYENMLAIVDAVEAHVDAQNKLVMAAVLRMLESLHVKITPPTEKVVGEPHGEVENY
jgi:hypothetical protein